MTPAEFKKKWSRYQGKESSAYQEHFCDLCRLLGQPTPVEADPSGNDFFCFQKGVIKDAELLGLDGRGMAEHPAEVVEMLLVGGGFLARIAMPFLFELCRCHCAEPSK